MKNLLELYNVAESLAESLATETNQKRIHAAQLEKFDSLALNDADWPVFQSFFKEAVLRASEKSTRDKNRSTVLLETEKLRLAAEKTKSAATT